MIEAEAESVLSKTTGITIGLGIVVLGAAITAAWWFGNWTGADSAWKNMTASQLDLIEIRLKSIEQGQIQDRWTGSDMERWADRLAEDNPDIDVPTPLRR